jgi:hypothetical protein
MRFENVQGTQIELTIIGYEYPDKTSSVQDSRVSYDANWLIVAVRYQSVDGAWEFTRPCLLTWEIERLVSWLHAVADKQDRNPTIEFTEPRVTFEVLAVDAELISLRMECLQAGRPNRKISMWADMMVTVKDLHAAAEALRSELARFPIRGKRPTLA